MQPYSTRVHSASLLNRFRKTRSSPQNGHKMFLACGKWSRTRRPKASFEDVKDLGADFVACILQVLEHCGGDERN